MRFVIFGLTISSSWGNGHATLWRGLCGALTELGHGVTFFERDTPYYASNRDIDMLPGGHLVLYHAWEDVAASAKQAIRNADIAIVTSYCPDAIDAGHLIHDCPDTKGVFYDLDASVTLDRLCRGQAVPYIDCDGLDAFDIVLSYCGGPALAQYAVQLRAPRVAALYGHVDPTVHRPAAGQPCYRADLSYLGTYSADRQTALERLLIEPARTRLDLRFLIGGAQYPPDFPWSPNIYFVRHLPPAEHPDFFCSSRITLNVTRPAMAAMGWCPSGRLFEAAACGTPIMSDMWPGIEAFFEPGEEILIVSGQEDVLRGLSLERETLVRMAARARERVLSEHTSTVRARELIALVEDSGKSPVLPDVVEV